MGWFSMTFLLSYVLVSAIRKARMDFLSYEARHLLRRDLQGVPLSPLQRDWTRMLKSYHKLRRESAYLDRKRDARTALNDKRRWKAVSKEIKRLYKDRG